MSGAENPLQTGFPQSKESRPFGEPILPRSGKGVIWAADVQNEDRLFAVLDQIADSVAMVKVGHPLLWACGVQIISEIRRRYGISVLADGKICDVPDIVDLEVATLYKSGADGVLIVGITGGESIRRAIEVDARRMVFVLTELTHDTGLIDDELAEESARVALRAKAYGIQAPGTKPERITSLRAIVGPDLKIIACGIGVQGGKAATASQHGADYAIIGREVTNAQNPRGIVAQCQWAMSQPK
jgi:orotidine-5'-phosphate decarboxylase